MLGRLEKAKQDSDVTYFNDLLLFGELIIKVTVSSIVSSILDDTERHRYRLLHKLVRVDGIGEWASVLDEALTGVASQHFQNSVRDNEQKELTMKVNEGNWQFECVDSLYQTIKTLDINYNQLGNKVQAKTWFQLFAVLRNGTRGHGALTTNKYSESVSYLEKSINILINNFFLFKREWAFLYQTLAGKYRVTRLNSSSEKFNFLKSEVSQVPKYPNGVFVVFDRITQVEFISSNQDAEDFYFPNGNFREKKYELLSYCSGNRKEGDATKYLTPATSLPSSETEGIGILDIKGECFWNVPAIYQEYVRREQLESDLSKILLQEDRYPIVTLVGKGGIGKTSLALKVLHEVAHEKRFDLILWFSARDIDLTIDGPKSVKNNILNEGDIAIEFCRLLGVNSKTVAEKVAYLASELGNSKSGKTLFVFDNFETVSNPIELFNWIDTYIRNPNKVLITSRTSRSFKADYPIEISGMSHIECQKLINYTAKYLKIEHLLTHENISDLIEESNGHPYVIKILLGIVAKNNKFAKIERIIASQDDILNALFRRTYNTLSFAAKRVFLTLCSWRSLVPQIALEAILLRDSNERMDVDDAVEELKRNSFIELSTSLEDNNIFIAVPLVASSFGRAELAVSPMKIEVMLDRDLLMEFGVAQQSDIQAGLKPRIERKIKQIANQASKGEDITKHFPMLEYIARGYPRTWILLAELHKENGENEQAIDCLKEFLKTDASPEDTKAIWQNLSNLYRIKEDWLGEINALIEKCCLPKTSLLDVSETANAINSYLAKNINFESKLSLDSEVKSSLIQKVADLMQSKINKGSATDYSRLSWLYLHLNNRDLAIEMMNKGLDLDSENIYCLKLQSTLN